MSPKIPGMNDKNEQLDKRLERLKNELYDLIVFFEQGHDYTLMVYEWWNAKDILGHITFWHESFARNIADIGRGVTPQPLKGKLSEVNKTSVETTEKIPIGNLILRLKDAQNIIEQNVFNENIGLIPYKKGSRDYTCEEHLEVVANHIHKHLLDLKKKFNHVATTK